jgi:hypothetical protein
MANYLGDYQSDSGRFFYRIRLQVYLIDTSSGTRTLINTSLEEDEQYLPPSWYNKTSPLIGKALFCESPKGMRFALIYLTDTRYLNVDIPFIPGSNDYYNFFLEIAYKLKGIGKTIGLQGEKLDSRRLKIHVKNSN